MSTIEGREKAGTLARCVQDWSGGFEGESRLVLGELIAAYFNGSAIEDSVVAVVRQRASVSRSMIHANGFALIAEMLLIESHFHFPGALTRERAVADLMKHRLRFCGALRWLCTPKTTESAVSSDDLEALAASGNLDWGRYPEIDERSDLLVAYFEVHGVKHFKRHLYLRDGRLLSTWLPLHLIDLFCVFLLTECEGKAFSQMPMKFCRRCSKLFFTALEGKARERKQFCSTNCQEGGHWTKSKRARSDSGFVERLLENTRAELRNRLANPTVQKRLARVKNDWKAWETLMLKVEAIDGLAK